MSKSKKSWLGSLFIEYQKIGLYLVTLFLLSGLFAVPSAASTLPLSGVVIYGTQSVSIGSNAVISGGAIYSGGILGVGSNSAVTGNLYGNGVITVGANCKITGNVDSRSTVSKGANVSITGQTRQMDSSFTLPSFSIIPDTLGTTDLTIPANGSGTITAGHYRNISIGNNAIATFSGGRYHCATMTLGTNATITVTSTSTILCNAPLSINSNIVFSGNASSEKDLQFQIAGSGTSTIGANAKFRGGIFAPAGTVVTQSNAQVSGVVMAGNITINLNLNATYASVPIDTVKTAGPVVKIVSPSADTLVNHTPITIRYTVNGGAVLSKQVALVEGLNTVVIDTAISGIHGSASVKVTLDDIAPVVKITSPASMGF